MNLTMSKVRIGVATLILSAAMTAAFADTIVIRTNNYDGGATSDPAYSFVSVAGAGVATPVQGYAGIGVGSNIFSGNLFRNAEPLPTAGSGGTFTNLPLGGTLSFSFLLAVIGSWDGNDLLTGGPDRLELVVNNSVVWTTTLSNFSLTSSNGGTLLSSGNFFADPLNYVDSAWNFTNVAGLQNIPYAGTTFDYRVRAAGTGWSGGADESWGLDNFRVTLTTPVAAIPEPETYALMLAGLGALGFVARRRKSQRAMRSSRA